MSRLPYLLPLITLVACSGSAKDTDSNAVETDSETDADTDADTDTDTDADADTSMTVAFSDLATHAAIANTPATVNGAAYTTDANGDIVVVGVPATNLHIRMAPENYPPLQAYLIQAWTNGSQKIGIPSNATLAGLSGALGITLDPGKSMVVIGVFDRAGHTGVSEFLEEVTISLNVAYDVALVSDSNSPYGFTPGNTTLVGSMSSVVFVNVDPGTVSPSFSVPDGRPCDIGWPSFDAPAGAYTALIYHCERP